ncbi:MAG: glutamyl-tRNA reductase [Alphaproteobacteria bacterium]
MHLALVGTNHKQSPLNVRERLAITGDDLPGALQRLRRTEGIRECLIISTCNRTEVVAVFDPQTFHSQKLADFMARESRLPHEELQDYLYRYLNKEAVQHLFEVACGADSMILGETQVFGQVKDGYSAAVAAETAGPLLHKLMHTTFRVTKRLRSQTSIGEGTLSVSQIACDLAEKIFAHLSRQSVLLIGAGENAEMAARLLRERGVTQMVIANRTPERAAAMAKNLSASSVPFDDLSQALEEADIVIASTGAKQPILTLERIQPVLARRRKPLFIIDMAVPRDVDPQVNELEGVFVYDIDELGRQVEVNQRQRQTERQRCCQMIETETEKFMEWYASFKATPTIKEIQQQVENIRLGELEALRDQLTPEDLALVDTATKRMTSKILAPSILHVKDAAKKPDSKKVIDIIRNILGLHGEIT